MAARKAPLYRWHDLGIVRATTYPDGFGAPADVDLSGPDAHRAGIVWLESVWGRPEVRCTVGDASPDLARRIRALVSAPESGALRDVRRAVVALGSYLLRWHGRPTPFGRFAGIAPLRIGADLAGTKVRWGDDHLAAVGVDAAWLGGVIARLLQCPELLNRLHVVANTCTHERGTRIAVPGPPGDHPVPTLAPIEVSVPASRPVRVALEAAYTPVRYAELHARLATQFPSATPTQIDTVLSGLVTHNLLITCLHAPMTNTDPLGHICRELRAIDAHHLPDVRSDVEDLYALHDQLAITPADIDTADRRRTVDTGLDCDVRVPEHIAREARDAAVVLYRLSPYPHGHPQWRDYHSRFRARYGVGAVVPVHDLVADSGLGLPADYLGASRGRGPRQLAARDEQIMAWVQRAMLDGTGEIVLTDAMIDELAGQPAERMQLPPRTEIAVTVLADTGDALDRGDFHLVVTGTPRPGSSMAGRLAHLLPDADVGRLAASYTGRDGLAAQLVFPPRKRRNENVSRTRQLLPHVISLSEHRPPAPGQIPLHDLGVTADAYRFQLVRLSTGESIEPRVLHALEAAVHTPPLARFLAEVCTARCTVYQGFHFGTASRLPYLPRVRYRRTILAPARWLATADDIAPRGTPAARPGAGDVIWAASLDAWRQRMRVPDRVVVIDYDRRLPLDLRRNLDRIVLRSKLDRAGRVELRETYPAEATGWIGRAHELLIPLIHEPVLEPHRALLSQGARLRSVPVEAANLPGDGTVMYAQLHGHPARQDELLTEHLPRLIADIAAATGPDLRWWFRRHREMRRPDADQYLALYLLLPATAGYGATAERLSGWVEDLLRARLLAHLTLATYEPQTGRYGYGPALDAAHGLFAADSAAALAQIRAAVGGRHPGLALAAASIVDLTAAVTGSLPGSCAWLIRELPHRTGLLDPAMRDAAFALTLDTVDHSVADAWRDRAHAAAAYRAALTAQHHDPQTVLRSLLHYHHVRALGVDPDHERVTERLARACALRMTARQPVSEEGTR